LPRTWSTPSARAAGWPRTCRRVSKRGSPRWLLA